MTEPVTWRPSLTKEFINMRKYENSKSPLFGWVGGKSWLIPTMLKFYRRYNTRRFCDLFCGGLAIPLYLNPKRVLINDANKPLITLYRGIRDYYGQTYTPQIKSVEDYYRVRDLFNSYQQFYVGFYSLMTMSYGGLCRFNKRGLFNSPPNKELINSKRGKGLTGWVDFSPYKEKFKDWEILSEDFSDVPINEEDFVFCDPPYVNSFTSYTGNKFEFSEHIRLLGKLKDHKGPVFICNKDTEDTRLLYSAAGYKVLKTRVSHRVKTKDRKSVNEIIAYKNFSLF